MDREGKKEGEGCVERALGGCVEREEGVWRGRRVCGEGGGGEMRERKREGRRDEREEEGKRLSYGAQSDEH